MTYTPTSKTMERITGEAYSTMLEYYEDAKKHLGEMVLESIKNNNWNLRREDDPELFELIDLWQLDDAYILNAATNLSATLHSHRHRNGTKYTSMSYEMTID